MTESISRRLVAALDARLDAYLDDLRTMTGIDCPTSHKAGLDEIAGIVSRRLEDLDARIEVIENADAGNDVVGVVEGHGTKRVTFLCHTDTVYPVGTVATRPFLIEGSHILAPGAADMKGGLLSAIYAVHALQDVGYEDFAVMTILCTSDEEAPPRHSLERIQETARKSDCVLTMEPARINGNIVSARKGSLLYTLSAYGREAHAGVAPETGRNAIVALAERVLEIWRLNGMRQGLTINPGVIRGGTTSNTVAREATCIIDVRVKRLADIAAFESEVQELLSSSIIPDIQFDLQREAAMPPMQKNRKSQRLVDLAKQAAAEIGFEVEDTATGGGSDGSYAAEAGVPVLDGLGPIGGNAHSEREYLELPSIVPRTAMLARLVTLV